MLKVKFVCCPTNMPSDACIIPFVEEVKKAFGANKIDGKYLKRAIQYPKFFLNLSQGSLFVTLKIKTTIAQCGFEHALHPACPIQRRVYIQQRMVLGYFKGKASDGCAQFQFPLL